MASQQDHIIQAQRLKDLKQRIKNECRNKRNHDVTLRFGTHQGTQLSITGGSVAEYGTSNWDYNNPPTTNRDALIEHFNKVIIPLRAININRVPDGPSDRVITDADITNMETAIAALELRDVYNQSATDCFTMCTGTCTTTCTGGCANGCTNSCQGCGRSCSYDCSNGCEGGCGDNCTGQCRTNCTTGCGTGCSGDCIRECATTSSCSSGAVCSSGCSSTCSGGCYTGCSTDCYGGCSTECGDQGGGDSACGNACKIYTQS